MLSVRNQVERQTPNQADSFESVIGVAHGILARALLMCYDPTLPKIGASRIAALQGHDHEIRQQIRDLCGIALSNKATIPALITAALGIMSCGDRFVLDAERRALLDILVVTDTVHSWPTAQPQHNLKEAWGWL